MTLRALAEHVLISKLDHESKVSDFEGLSKQLAEAVCAALDRAPLLDLDGWELAFLGKIGNTFEKRRLEGIEAWIERVRADHDAVILRLTSQLHDAKGVMPSATGSSPAQDSAEAGVTHPATNTSAIPECLSALLARWRGEAYTLGEANLDDSGHYPTRALRAERAKTLRECADSLEGAHGQAAARSLATDAPTITQGPNASGGDSADDVARVSRLGTIGTREYFTSGNSGVTTGDLGRYALLRQERTKELEATLQAQAATIQQLERETYAHMCQDEHARIGHNDSEHERCPVCFQKDRAEAAEARVATLTQRIAELEASITVDAPRP